MKYLIVFLLILNSLFALSQANYHKGSVTSNDGKVLTGYIDAREWEENPKSIAFKTSLDDKKPVIFAPATITQFMIDGFDTYYSYTGTISLNRTRLTDLSYNRDTTTAYGNFFLKLVTTGDKITLLSYTDSLKTRYFAQENKSQPIELDFQEYYYESASTTRQDTRYKGQLIYLAGKYNVLNENLRNSIEKATYNSTDIEDIIKTINGNKNAVNKTAISHTRYFIGAAVNFSNSGFGNSSDFYNSKDHTVTPRICAGLDIYNNPNVQQLILRVEANFSYVNPQIVYNNPNNSYSYNLSQKYTYTQYNVNLTPQLIYNIYNKDAFKIYLDLGIGFNVSKYTNHKRTVTQTYTFSTPQTSATSDIQPYVLETGPWLNFPIQAGVVLQKRFEVFAGYTGATAYTKYATFSVSTQTYSAGIHYLFGAKSK